jgi:putative Mg2+ transporter-C (MgtC) family protein
MNPEAWQIDTMELTIRIAAAMVIGGLIGLEREFGEHAAGFRTHILVCLGSALIMLLSIYGFSEFATEPNVQIDPARLAAQVISGIGFLGAGTILRTGVTISGLTTAASLWVVAALGLAVGAGFYYGALLATALVLINLFFLNKLEKYLTRKRKPIEITVVMADSPGSLVPVMEALEHYGAAVNHLNAEPGEGEDEESRLRIRLRVKIPNAKKIPYLLDALRNAPGVSHVQLQYLDRKVRKGKFADFIKQAPAEERHSIRRAPP